MLPPDQDGSTRARFESELELRLPARRRGLYLSHSLKEEDQERVEGAHELRLSDTGLPGTYYSLPLMGEGEAGGER